MKLTRSTLSLLLYTAQILLERASTQYENGHDCAADDTLGALGKVLRFEPEEDAPEPSREVLDQVTRPLLCTTPGCAEVAERMGLCAECYEEGAAAAQRRPASSSTTLVRARRKKLATEPAVPSVEPTVPLDRHSEPVFGFDHDYGDK